MQHSNEEVNVLLLQKSFLQRNCSGLDFLLFMLIFLHQPLEHVGSVEICSGDGWSCFFGLRVIIKWLMQIQWAHFFSFSCERRNNQSAADLIFDPNTGVLDLFLHSSSILGYLYNLLLFPHGFGKNNMTFISLLFILSFLLTQLNCYPLCHVWCTIRNSPWLKLIVFFVFEETILWTLNPDRWWCHFWVWKASQKLDCIKDVPTWTGEHFIYTLCLCFIELPIFCVKLFVRLYLWHCSVVW